MKVCAEDVVKKKIIDRHATWGKVRLDQSVADFEHLYEKDYESPKPLELQIPMFNQNRDAVYRKFVAFGKKDLLVHELYHDYAGFYDPSIVLYLLKERLTGFGPKAFLLHNDHYWRIDDDKENDWKNRLSTAAEVYTFPQLSQPRKSRQNPLRCEQQLSYIFQLIVKGLPQATLSILQAHWPAYEPVVKESDSLCEAFRQTKVGTNKLKDECVALQSTFLPTSPLLEYVADISLGGYFPFVTLNAEVDADVESNWGFLTKRLKVERKAGLPFFLECLRRFATAIAKEDLNTSALLKIYGDIERSTTCPVALKKNPVLV